jgi:KaiC/GvpD/RAD55 family RecA-like ATPase
MGDLGWILGPPGTGKSTTALAFASTLDKKDWIVTWIHLSQSKCVRNELATVKLISFLKFWYNWLIQNWF